MNKLFFVSSNEAKIQEAQLILGVSIEIVSLDLVEIQDFDIENIVRQKAQTAYEQIKQPLIVDDVGFYVKAWNDFPGPFIKYIIQRGGPELLLDMLKNTTNKKAYCISAIGYHDGQKVHTFLGKVTGKITDTPMGSSHAKGFNAIFIPDGSDKTYSEMTLEEKSKLSHRKKSLELLKKFL
ncbi:MAG TPA: non-canonical purine NTP pyrophosphatase [Methylomirabilota bacterium]|nr:non-canonical purine NTP pyrophosphatase [Methylomirabilota bacterium]